jgi:CspA family cold shock protein
MASRSGTVKWFNDAKGYGFIEPDDKSKDVFVHFSAIIMQGHKKLEQGDRVEFETIKGDKGFQASQVEVLAE